jgi:hypothetical protein
MRIFLSKILISDTDTIIYSVGSDVCFASKQ